MDSAIESASRLVSRGAGSVVEEVLEEITADSKRSWGLILFAFVLGFAAAVAAVVWFGRREAVDVTDASDATAASAPDALDNDAHTTSKWSERRAQIARSDAAMRGRVGRLGSRLHVGRTPEAE